MQRAGTPPHVPRDSAEPRSPRRKKRRMAREPVLPHQKLTAAQGSMVAARRRVQVARSIRRDLDANEKTRGM